MSPEEQFKNLMSKEKFTLDELKSFSGQRPDEGDVKIAEKKSRELTFGEKLVGLTFNPSGDDKVTRAKQLCAELADLVKGHVDSSETSPLQATLYSHTIGEILNAQMNVVKVLTLKY